MLLKMGVDHSRLADQMRRVLPVIDRVFRDFGQEAVITSTYEGDHSPGSLHYVNRAVDVRLPPKAADVVASLSQSLGPLYDVVLERDHIHIEHDPA